MLKFNIYKSLTTTPNIQMKILKIFIIFTSFIFKKRRAKFQLKFQNQNGVLSKTAYYVGKVFYNFTKVSMFMRSYLRTVINRHVIWPFKFYVIFYVPTLTRSPTAFKVGVQLGFIIVLQNRSKYDPTYSRIHLKNRSRDLPAELEPPSKNFSEST